MKKLVISLLSIFCIVLFSSCGKRYTITVEDTDFAMCNSVEVIEIDQYEKVLNTREFYSEKSEPFKAYPGTKEIIVKAYSKNNFLRVELPVVCEKIKLHPGLNNVRISMKDDNNLPKLIEDLSK